MYQNDYLHGSPSKFSTKAAIYTAAGCQRIIAIYTAAVPEQIQTIYTAAVCPHKIAINTAAIQEPNRLLTLLPGVYKNRYLHGSRSRAKSAIYIAAGCIQNNRYLHGSRSRANRLYALLPGVYINCYLHVSHSRAKSAIYIAAGWIYMKLLFTRQPFKSQIDSATTLSRVLITVIAKTLGIMF